VTFQFDNYSPWNGPASGLSFGASTFLGFTITSEDSKLQRFMIEAAAANHVVISYQGQQIANWPLYGSAEAFTEMARCNSAMARQYPEETAIPADPFRGATPARRDPFING
jgi:hypothetical protein